MPDLIIGTRRSRLARIQAGSVRRSLLDRFPGLEIEERVIVTKGDRILDSPLSAIGDKGLFTREIELRLLDGTIDLAVHSYKDLPSELPGGLAIGAIVERKHSEDALVAGKGVGPVALETLPAGARIGTSSLRRASLLVHLRPDLVPVDIRGNVDTRLDKLDRSEYDALILACAGLIRLGREDRISSILGPEEGWFHAAGQGALALEVRDGDERVLELVSVLDHPRTRMETAAERGFMAELGGGCRVPAGVRVETSGDRLALSGMVAGLQGEPFFEGVEAAHAGQAADAGRRLAQRLLDRGADAIIDGIRKE